MKPPDPGCGRRQIAGKWWTVGGWYLFKLSDDNCQVLCDIQTGSGMYHFNCWRTGPVFTEMTAEHDPMEIPADQVRLIRLLS